MAAVQGHNKAQYRLGVMYEKGIGVSQDIKEALKWKLMAAEQGEPRAQNNMGVKYAKGKGVKKNYRNAYMCRITSYNVCYTKLLRMEVR